MQCCQLTTTVLQQATSRGGWRMEVLLLACIVWRQVHHDALLLALPLYLCPEHVLELLSLLPGLLQTLCFQLRDSAEQLVSGWVSAWAQPRLTGSLPLTCHRTLQSTTP